MTWDPDGIVVGEAFRDYVQDLRETSNYASGGGKARFSETMNDTTSDADGGVTTTNAAIDSDMTRRAFAVGVGATVATAAGTGVVSASDTPNWDGDLVQSPEIEETVTITEHSEDMSGVLEYIDDGGNVVTHTASVASREESDEPHNPVTLRVDRFATEEYRAFPRGETYEDADGDDVDLSAIDDQHWTVDDAGTAGTVTLETTTGANGEDALHFSTDGQGAGDVASATFTDVEITSGVARKYIQLVTAVAELSADAAVYLRVHDSGTNTIETWIDSDATETDLGTIATSTGYGVVFQAQTGEFETSLDDIDSVELAIEDGDADLEISGLNLDRESRWEFGTREYLDEDDSLSTETVREPAGEYSITSLGSLPDVFASGAIMDKRVDVELHATDLEASSVAYRWKDAGRYDRDERLETLIGYELETAYDLSYEGGRAIDEVHFPGSRYLNARFSREDELPDWSDVDDLSWSDRSTDYDNANVGDDVTVTSDVNPDEMLVFNFDVLMSSDEREEATSTGGAGGGPTGSSGGFFGSVWGILLTAFGGVAGYVAWTRRKAGV